MPDPDVRASSGAIPVPAPDTGAYSRIPSGYKAGWYLGHPGTASTGIPAEASLCFLPLFVPKAVTVDRIVAEITVSGTVGAVVRLGIYNSNSDGIPSTLILDAGTIDGTATPAIYPVTISQALPAGLVFLAAVVQGVAGTRPTMRTRNIPGGFLPAHDLSNAVSFNITGYAQAGVTGALPATAAITGGTATVASLGVRLV